VTTLAPEAQIAPARGEHELAAVARLFREYQVALGVDLCFQGFEREVSELPGEYGPPRGDILLARVGRVMAGVVALRPLDLAGGEIAEMKRLYVRPAFRGRRLGRLLAESCIEAARRIGYRHMRLDTLARLTAANSLYRTLGFTPISPYNDNPLADVLYYECPL
jgi:GNAT superfamily N-acetyltransferase